MEGPIPLLHEGLARLSALDILLLGLNTLFLLTARGLITRLDHSVDADDRRHQRLHLFRAVNLLLLLLILFSNFLPVSGAWITRLLEIFLVGYLGFIGYHLLGHMIRRRFGREREVEGRTVLSESYTSRVLSLIAASFTLIIGLITVVRILGFESLLEAGGVIGFVGVFLALTQGAWAPDIIGGLIILNSRLAEEGDVLEFRDGGSQVFGLVFKTKVFHTEILDLINNHRILLQNSRLREMTINNLSKFASAKGLREELQFKIGYEVPEARVRDLFNTAFERAVKDADIPVEAQHPPQVRAMDAGDYAILWSLFYHTKEVRNLPRTRQLFRALVIEEARERRIGLATPILYSQVQVGGGGLPDSDPVGLAQ